MINVTDPLDGTISSSEGRKDQASGTVLIDKSGNFAGTIISLVEGNNDLFFVEGRVNGGNNKAILLSYDDRTHKISTKSIDHTGPADPFEARIASLDRRWDTLRSTPLFSAGKQLTLNSLGGMAALLIVNGDLDAAIDPKKGRPLEEAIIWDFLLQQAGFIVADPDGRTIDFIDLLQRSVRGEIPMDGFRIPLITSRSPELMENLLPLLR